MESAQRSSAQHTIFKYQASKKSEAKARRGKVDRRGHLSTLSLEDIRNPKENTPFIHEDEE